VSPKRNIPGVAASLKIGDRERRRAANGASLDRQSEMALLAAVLVGLVGYALHNLLRSGEFHAGFLTVRKQEQPAAFWIIAILVGSLEACLVGFCIVGLFTGLFR
jgi:hypothetical protein